MSTAESLVKRRGSPSLLASKEPNPKRIEACADSSLITQLFNDKFIKGLACVLAEEEKIVGMAKKLFEGAKSEHGTLDLDAWKYFTSMPIWRNDKLMQYPTKMGPKQQHLNQQIQETKARINDDPSLKPLFAEKEHIRVVLVLVILFWSRDVCGLEDKDVCDLEDQDVCVLEDGTNSCASVDFEELELEPDEEPDHGCCAYNKSFDVDRFRMNLPPKDEKMMMDYLADVLLFDHRIVEICRELLGTVQSVSPLGALEHLDKVKEVWGNHRFIDHLLKFECVPRPRVQSVSNVRLSIKIWSLIKEDPLFEVISEYKDPDFRMRVASSILIGFWSNEDMIRPLVYTMGGDALGVKKEQSGEEEEESPHDWMSNSPNILEFYRDKSIWELADQLKEEPAAVKWANFYLEALETLELDDCYCSYLEHFKEASSFWYDPSIILKLKEAMEKDPKLVKVLTKYSKGAETLRGQERMIHIRKDFQLELRSIDSYGSHSKMRLALNILFSYWVDRDMTQLFESFRNVKKIIGKGFDLSEEEEIGAFYYYASSAKDVEGLKSWLANKYGKGSNKALSLAKQIGKYQKLKGEEAEKCGYSDGPLCIQLVLNKSSILTFSLSWLCWGGFSTITGQHKTLLGGPIPLEQVPL